MWGCMSTSLWNTRIVGGLLFALLGFNIALLGSRGQLHKWVPSRVLRQSTPAEVPPVTAHYGKQLSADFLRLLDANVTAASKHRFLFLVSTPDLRAIDYLQVLGETYGEFIVPAVVSTVALDQTRSVSPSVMVVPDWPSKTGLQLGDVNNLLVVLDAQGAVQFVAYGIPDLDVLRQLAEKYARDHIDYRRAGLELQQVFTPGQPLPPLAVVGLNSPGRALKLAELLPGGGRLFVFTARCNTCQMSQFGADVSKLRSESATADIATAVLITEPGVGLEALAPALRAMSWTENAFVVAPGSHLYDPVTTRIAETFDRPLVVDVAPDHTITNVRSLAAGS